MTAYGIAQAPGQFGVLGVEARRDWPPLTNEEARDVLGAFALPAPIEAPIDAVIWHGQRPFSATGLIRLGNGETVFLKRHDHRLRDAASLAEEHGFIAHLAHANLPVSPPYATTAGPTSIGRDNWIYEAFPPLHGTDLYRDIPSWEPYLTLPHAHAAGVMLGRLHRAAASYVAPPRRNRMLLSSLDTLTGPSLPDAIAQWLPTQPGLADALSGRRWREETSDVLSGFHASLQPLLPALTPAWGHGDWHGSNLFWSTDPDENPVAAILDFGMSDRTAAPFDLAVAIERSFIRWLDTGAEKATNPDQLATFLTGYLAENPLSRSEKALTLALLPLVHVAFALSEVAYYHALVHDPASAEIAYSGYLLGHAKWFSAPQGRAFLHYLANALEMDRP